MNKKNSDLLSTIEIQEEKYKQIEESLQMVMDQTQNQIEEQLSSKQSNEQKLKEDTETMENQIIILKVKIAT